MLLEQFFNKPERSGVLPLEIQPKTRAFYNLSVCGLLAKDYTSTETTAHKSLIKLLGGYSTSYL